MSECEEASTHTSSWILRPRVLPAAAQLGCWHPVLPVGVAHHPALCWCQRHRAQPGWMRGNEPYSPQPSESLSLISLTSPFTGQSHAETPRVASPSSPTSGDARRSAPQSWLHFALGTILPFLMISAGMLIQHNTQLAATDSEERPADEPAGVPQRILNLQLLNRSCAPYLIPHYALKTFTTGTSASSGYGAASNAAAAAAIAAATAAASAAAASAAASSPHALEEHGAGANVRVVVGTGFVASGLSSLSHILERVPGSCRPLRPNLGFWSSLPSTDSDKGSTGEVGGAKKTGRAAQSVAPTTSTRQRYLQEAVRLRNGCSVPWELTERYTSLTSRHSSPPAVCTPLMIGHHFPHARVVMMLADPVERAHTQQSAWLHSRCFRDPHEAASARLGGKGRFAKGAVSGCERLDANTQLRMELVCLRTCKLRVDSPISALQLCASTCGRALRAAFPCKPSSATCPFLSLIHSFYALVLPLWFHTFPCEHILLLEHQVCASTRPYSQPSCLATCGR